MFDERPQSSVEEDEIKELRGEGKTAFKAGDKECPYPDGTKDARHWCSGYAWASHDGRYNDLSDRELIWELKNRDFQIETLQREIKLMKADNA